MKSRFIPLLLLVTCVTAHADFVQGPGMLVYAPNLLNGYVQEIGQVSLGGALPAGSGSAIMAFAHLLGLIAVWKSLKIFWESSNPSAAARGGGGWGSAFLMFIAGICVVHIDKTMGMLAATFPGFPDLTEVLRY